jgi:hypothetical protein
MPEPFRSNFPARGRRHTDGFSECFVREKHRLFQTQITIALFELSLVAGIWRDTARRVWKRFVGVKLF